MSKIAFAISWVLLSLAPIYGVVCTALSYWSATRTPLLVLPVFLIFVPAGAYVLSRRCPNCRNLIYTTKTLQAAGKLYAYPPARFKSCPSCGHELD